jgi:hypothetical protein
MTTSIRHTTSAATALGLVSFTASSALFSGLFATPTLVAFSLLAVYGLLEIAILSYATPHERALRPASAAIARIPTVRRVPAVIEYPVFRRPAVRACAA